MREAVSNRDSKWEERRKILTVSLSIRRTFIPGPQSSIILVTYNFTAKITFMAALSFEQ